MNQNPNQMKTISLTAAAIGLILIAAGLYPSLTGTTGGTAPVIEPFPKERWLILAGSLLLIIGGAAFLWYRQKAAGSADGSGRQPSVPNRIIPEGRITASVIGISRNLRMEGEKETFYVLCRYTDPETGIELTFTSCPLDNYPGKDLIGKNVIVHLRSLADEDYRVDLDSIL